MSMVFAFLCYFLLDISGSIPYIFSSFALLNTLVLLYYKRTKNLLLAAILTAVLSFVGATAITFLSGGINSPFIYVLALIVFGGYISALKFGKIYLICATCLVVLTFLFTQFQSRLISNEVPINSQDTFSLLSILFSVYLLGGVFGKDLLKSHREMSDSKNEIEQKIKEKEVLLKTVHHRVKNNLQMVSSLLNLQSKNSMSPSVKDVVLSSQARVNAMATIHEMLYHKKNLAFIDFNTYIEELTNYLTQTVNNRKLKVEISIDIPEIKIGIDTAIPLGLLINEMVINSIKHAFPNHREGRINIIMSKEQDDKYRLQMSDNGVGYSEIVELRTSTSLGLKLIHTLARQLKGSARRILNKPGTTYEVYFQEITTPILSEKG